MNSTTAKVKKLLSNQLVKDSKKLEQQQAYYKRLLDAGTAKKQTYNLKPTSAI